MTGNQGVTPVYDHPPPSSLLKHPNMSAINVNEPLIISAPLANDWSKKLCLSHGDGACNYYHGFWQYLRLLGLGSTLGGHPQEYLREFRDLSIQWTGATKRVLISGCADYSMLAHLIKGFAESHCIAEFTALDQCMTPLTLNEWYAQRVGVSIHTVCSDVLSYQPSKGFDLIVTSSFLGYFSDEERPSLFRKFRELLNPGGVLIFSNRLRPHVAVKTDSFSHEDTLRLMNAVVERSDLLPPDFAIDKHELRSMAGTYAKRRTPYPVRSVQEIETLSQAAGLRIESSRIISNPSGKVIVNGPTLNDGSGYVMVRLSC